MLSYVHEHHAANRAPLVARVIVEHVSRRGFLRGTAAGTGLVIAAQVVPFRSVSGFEPYPTGADGMPHGVVTDPNVWVAIDPDGTVTITTHRSEMGTGARTSLPMVVADEMNANWAQVVIAQAPGDEPKYGNQDTDGSRSMRHFIQPMREVGATVRLMLERAGAKRLGVEDGEVKAVAHEVVHEPSGQTLGFGDLAEEAMAQPVPPREDLAFKDEADFSYLGKGEVPITDLHDITTGKAVYGADVRLPGMKVAVIARPPVVGGKVTSYDAEATLAVPGVEQVVELEGSIPPAKFAPLGGLAVIAANTHAAIEGRDRLVITWEDGPHGAYTTETFRAEMEATARQPGKVIRAEGDADAAFANAAQVLSAEYYQPHMAHIPMEPPAALASLTDSKLEIWAPVQSPYGTRQDVAEATEIPIEDVTVNVTLLGGGFGRKSKCDFVLEAALLTQKVGAPVRVQWTREDDIRHCFHHTTSVERIEAAVDDTGKVNGWRHRSVAPSILSTFAEDSGYQFPIEYGMGLVDTPFDIANMSCENGKAFAHTRIGWFRAVSNVPRAFAVQSFVSELAHTLGRDEKEFLLELLGPDRIIDPKAHGFPEDWWNYGEPEGAYLIDTARLKKVVEVAAESAGWGQELPTGEGLGIAVHRSFVTYVASVVRVRVTEDGIVRVPSVHTAIDCGFAANPERIRSQIEGAAVMGMTLALNSAVTFENGRAMQHNYNDYDVVRIDNHPELVTTLIIEHPFSVHASGVGEPGVPPFAPALCNAIFNATGKRIRSLPVADQLRA